MFKTIKFAVALVLLSASLTASAAKHNGQDWHKVDSLIEAKDQVKALDAVKAILEKAQLKKDNRTILLCFITQNRLNSPEQPDGIYDAQSYLLFDSLTATFKDDGLKAICHYLQAICINEYVKADRYNYSSRDKLGLTDDQLRDTIFYHFEKAFSLAGNKRSKDYKDFIPNCTNEYIKLHPSLKDVLFESSCIRLGYSYDLSNPSITALLRSDERIIGNASQFLEATSSIDGRKPSEWELYILKNLTQRSLKANADIRAAIDLKRLSIITDYTSDADWIKLSQKIEQLADTYSNKSRYSAGLYHLSAKILADHVINNIHFDREQRISLSQHTHDLIRKAMEIWPDGQIAYNCQVLVNSLKKRSISISFDRTVVAGKPNLGTLSFSNVDTVFFKAFRFNPDNCYFDSYKLNNTSKKELFEQFDTLELAAVWSVATGKTADRTEHYMWISLPPLRKGEYMIVASPDRNFADENCYSCREVTSSDIVFMPTYRTDSDDDCHLTGFIFDAVTGLALSECGYTLSGYYEDFDDSLFVIQGKTDPDGFFDLNYPIVIDYDMTLIIERDAQTDTLYFESRHSNNNNNYSKGPVHVKLNTDRGVYRPGDTVRYCGIVSETPSHLNGKIVADAPIAVSVSAGFSHDRIFFNTTTDAHGRFTGEWPIPSDFKPGWISLEAIVVPDGQDPMELMYPDDRFVHLQGTSVNITIESYSRSLMELTFDEMEKCPIPGTQAECSGKILTPLGSPVSGAGIQWSTSIGKIDEYSINRDFKQVILETGYTETSDDGTFTIRFKADNSAGNYLKLTARVTDRNGETQEFSKDINFLENMDLDITSVDIIGSPDETVFNVDVFSTYPHTGKLHVIMETIETDVAKGIDIYSAYKIEDYKRSEMSERAMSDNALTATFPNYNFGISEQASGPVIMDSVIEFRSGAKTQIAVPGLRTGRYKVTFSSDEAFIRSIDQTYNPNARSNSSSISKDMFISVANSPYDTPAVSNLVWAAGLKRIIMDENDTATVRIGSPYPGTVIRYDVINRNGSLCHGTFISDGLIHDLSFPVNEDLYGSILVVATAYNNGIKAKSFACQYIPYLNKHLNYELSTFHSNLTSGAQEQWSFRFTDKKGNPVKASVMIDMYDSVLDRFMENRWEFYPWLYPGFDTYNPIHVDDSYVNVSKPKRIPAYNGLKILDAGLSNPVISPIRYILRQEIRSGGIGASSVATYIPTLITTNTPIAPTDNPLQIVPTGIRKNLSHTGLYLTHLQTDADGFVNVRFKAPELLTRWKLQVFAYTDNLQTTGFTGFVTTSRYLMVESAATRFFRQGDVTDFTQKITNAYTEDMDVTVKVRFTDAQNGKPLDLTAGDSVRTVRVDAGGSVTVPFTLTIPDGVKSITCTVTAHADGFSDGQQETIPVLSNRVQVTTSMSLFNNGNETRAFKSDAPATSASGKVFDETLTLQYHSAPIWYALEALPSLTEDDIPGNLNLAYKLAARGIPYLIAYLHPEEKSKLKKEQCDENLMEQNVINLVELLNERQNSDGGWSWMPGGASSVYVTAQILYIYDYLLLTTEYSFYKGMQFLLSQRQESTTSLSHSDMMMLYLYFSSLKGPEVYYETDQETEFNKLLSLAEKSNYNHEDLYYRGLMIQLFMSARKTEMAHNLAERLISESGYSDEMGRFWQENRGGHLWHQAPIETQAILIRALMATGYEREANEAARWLLKQKETTSWGSTPATAAAVMALIETTSGSIPDQESGVTVTIGNNRIESGADGYQDGYMSRTWNGPVTPDMADITVTSSHKGISWGALYHTFTQNLDDVESSGNGIQLKRTLWRVVTDAQDERLEELTPGTMLRMGDRIKIKLEFTADRTYEFLQLKSERAASLEPVSTDAGYTYNPNQDMRYYRSPTNTSDDLYIERLEPGSYTIEYDLYVQKTGTYSMGLATIRCLYAPAYRAIAPNTPITVE